MRLLAVGVWMMCGVAMAQGAADSAVALRPVEAFKLGGDGPVIRRRVQTGQPFTVAGTRGVVLGQQEGTFEAWVLPVKLLSHFTIRANVDGYPVPIDVNAAASEIEVQPDHTTVTYSHIAFTLRQTMYAADAADDGTGAMVLFQVDAVRPVEFTFSFTPEMRAMWPAANYGVPNAEWVKRGTSGFYVLHTDSSALTGAVAMPGAEAGVMAPYQEKPQVHPLELKLRYEPKRDGARYFPLLMAAGRTTATATNAALEAKLAGLRDGMAAGYAAHAARYAAMGSEFTRVQTPDAGFDEAFRWAAISIEQLRAQAASGEMGLVAGYFSSGDSARPGFGWFFGRDTLYTLYAVNGFGDFALTRQALDFLMKRQRADGKMMHEYSQTAAEVDWKALPYMYAAADATPLFLTQMVDYVRHSGDVEYLKAHWAEVQKAWEFETTHDSDGDGIYDNVQGTGWVESWPSGMPHQEVYLALLDQQGSAAMSQMAEWMGDRAKAGAANGRALELGKKIEAEYYDAGRKGYAFSRNVDGTLDRTATVYPAIAWWNGGVGLEHADESFSRWASHDLSTDWGLRDVAESEPFYDPISYHQGSVWPLFTGWTSVAEYRTGRTLSGYAHLMQTADQTTTQDLGAVTELLSGAFFQPMGRSTSHQLWSSAMVIVPALRGMFGIDVDATAKTVLVEPRLPADWTGAKVDQLHVGQSVVSLRYERVEGGMKVSLTKESGDTVKLRSGLGGAKMAWDGKSMTVPLPPVEVATGHGLPLPGARTAQMKVLSETLGTRSLALQLEGMAGSVVELKVRRNDAKIKAAADGGVLGEPGGDGLSVLRVTFPAHEGGTIEYVTHTVTLKW